MARYHKSIEYDAERNVTTVCGTTFSLRPYVIEIYGVGAFLWAELLKDSTHFHRKANDSQPKENQDE